VWSRAPETFVDLWGRYSNSLDLAFTFTAPIGLNRVLHLHADPTDHERATAQ
jgi:hypothetical protein